MEAGTTSHSSKDDIKSNSDVHPSTINDRRRTCSRSCLITVLAICAVVAGSIGINVYFWVKRTTMNPPQRNPSRDPTLGPLCFVSNQELLDSVREYIAGNSDTRAFYGDISDWCVGAITSFEGLFNGDSTLTLYTTSGDFFKTFNEDISRWDTSNVTNMNSVFQGATSFNQNISIWDTTKVMDMSYMFSGATSFNQNISLWNTSNVIYMDYMFEAASSFNQDISKWDVSNVVSMGSMFAETYHFNQDISKWNTSNVGDVGWMFFQAHGFNQNLCQWDTKLPSSVQSDYMFYGSFCSNDSEPALRSNGVWNGPFCHNCNENTTTPTLQQSYPTGQPTNIRPKPQLSPILSTSPTPTLQQSYPTGQPTNFRSKPQLSPILSTSPQVAPTTIPLEPGQRCFESDRELHESVRLYVNGSTTVRTTYGDISDWCIGAAINFESLFGGYSSLAPGMVISDSLFYSFNEDISRWDTSKVTNMISMFDAASFNQDISLWDTSKVIDMSYMFYGASSFNQDISLWDTSNVIDMGYMFQKAATFNQNLSLWDTSNVVYMNNMFQSAASFNQDISNWDVSNVVTMDSMFRDTFVFNQDISKWNTTKVGDTGWMFYQANGFNQNLCSWDTKLLSSVIIDYMFYGSYCPNASEPTQTSDGVWKGPFCHDCI
jgi:surface protein